MAHKSIINNISASSSHTLLKLLASSIYSRRISANFSNVPKNTLSVCTFNILAPCYKRLSSEYDRESFYEYLWQQRHLSIINFLRSLQVHLICLQEFWFKNPLFLQLYESHLVPKYSLFTLQRTGLLDDGLAILVDSQYCHVLDKYELILNDIGNRIGLLLNLEFNGTNILLINIHLTFPHHGFEHRLRLKQMKKFLQQIHEYQMSKNLLNRCSIILCGDFNSSYQNDHVYQLLEKQFQSSYKFIHGNEPTATHLTHRHEELGVDFIFYQSNILEPISSELIPIGSDPLKWSDPSEWNLSDHRPIVTVFKYQNNH